METRRILMRSLAVAVVIASVIWTTTAAGPEKVNSCCTRVSTAVLTDPIIGIRLQRESLPCVKAVIFETEQGNKQEMYFCRDPRQRWVQEKVRQFFRAQRNKGLTSTPPPTSSISDQTHAGGSTQAQRNQRLTSTPPPTSSISDQTHAGGSTQAQRNQRLTSTPPPTSSISDQTHAGGSTQAQRNKGLTSTPPPSSSISDQTHAGGSTQATDSSSVTNV